MPTTELVVMLATRSLNDSAPELQWLVPRMLMMVKAPVVNQLKRLAQRQQKQSQQRLSREGVPSGPFWGTSIS